MMFEEKNRPDHLLSMTSLGYALSVKLWDKIKKNHLVENVLADLSVSHQFFFSFFMQWLHLSAFKTVHFLHAFWYHTYW